MSEQIEKDDRIEKSLSDNVDRLKEILGVGENFDVLCREVEVGKKKAAFFFVNGFVNQTLMSLLMRDWDDMEKDNFSLAALSKFLHQHVDTAQVSLTKSINEAVVFVLSGPLALFLDGEDQAVIIDIRSYPQRSIEEPELEKTVRGSRDGFVETLALNTALIRRRLRDPNLRMELVRAGKRSATDIVVAYIKDIADPGLVEDVKEKIQAIEVDGLPMAERSLAELLHLKNSWNPFPLLRYTQRPDVASIHLLEGHVLIIPDTTPEVIITPTTLWHHLQHAEEYRDSPAVGTFIRWVRFLGVAASLLLTPFWLLFALEPSLLPPALKFIGPASAGKIPLPLQFILADTTVEMIRQATLHVDTPLATSVGIIAAIVVGQYAAQIGLFIPEVIIYTSVVAIGTFLTPSYELSMANRLARVFLLILVGLYKLNGLIIGLLLIFYLLATSRTFGVPYLWPLLPFNWSALKSVLLRSPVPVYNIRPGILRPVDSTRYPAQRRQRGGRK